MRRWACSIAIAAAMHGAAAEAESRKGLNIEGIIDQVVAVMQDRQPADAIFDKRFLADVSAKDLRALARSLEKQGGRLHGVDDVKMTDAQSATFTMHFDRGSAPARIELNPVSGLVAGYRVFALIPADDTFAQIDAAFAALPGKAAYAVSRLGDEKPQIVAASQATASLAVASSFKLYVLAAVVRLISVGKLRWDTVLHVSGKSVPGGIVHSLPERAPITVHTLASLMISSSDNSATDMLMRLAGQEAIAAEVKASGHADPARLYPMMTTAQLFARKRLGPQAARTFDEASPQARADLLARLNTASIARSDSGQVTGDGPTLIESVEWFASPTDLVRIMDHLRRMNSAEADAILAINPAMDSVSAQRWAYVGYKGGSEDGVIAMTWLLRDSRGAWYAISGIWNDADAVLDNQRFELLMLRLADLTRRLDAEPAATPPQTAGH